MGRGPAGGTRADTSCDSGAGWAKAQIDSAALIIACISDWLPGSRQRDVRVPCHVQFLRFCPERKNFTSQ